MPSNVRRRAAAAALGLALLAACSGDDTPTDAASAETEVGVGAGNNEGEAAPPKGDAGVEDIDPADVVVEQTVGRPENPDDRVTLGVHSLQVEGDVMVLRLVVTPDLASESDSAAVSLFKTLGQSSFRPTLVDVEHLKEYSVIEHGTWSVDDVELKALNGEPMVAWAYFAAPEDDIDSVDLRVTDYWPTFTDVPISR